MNPLHSTLASSKPYAKDFKDPNTFISQLAGAINDQASAVKFYEVLEDMTPSQYSDFVNHAKNDEMEHAQRFNFLYVLS